VIAIVVACASAQTVPLTVHGAELRAEVADDPKERAQGLMHRDSLGADAGMVFVYPESDVRSFWMKDTRIPLSIAFLDADGVVVTLADLQPLDTRGVSSVLPAKYAVEANRGWFREHGGVVGDRVSGLPPAPAR
jgi:uncharacterized membrane protein (UPF0127 family)